MNKQYEKAIGHFMHTLDRYEMTMHSVLIYYKGELLFERYWKPYTKDRPHRMYSVTKSFVSAAIGILIGEGKLSLQDPIIQYFPDKLPNPAPEELKEQTIENMLRMQTCFFDVGNWFHPEITDRTAYYFHCTPKKPAGTVFDYDSTGSYVLGVLVERISGMPLLEFLREKIFSKLGGFEHAQMLLTPDGTSWGDSALLCTSRDLLNFARLMMQKGKWNGEQIVPESYVKMATSKLVETDIDGTVRHNTNGYGYQIWQTERGGFSFNGMAMQHAICLPDKDFAFVCTADLYEDERRMTNNLFRAVFEELVDGFEPQPEEKYELPGEELSIASIRRGEKWSPMVEKIQDAIFVCRENPMGIRWFSLHFENNGGVFCYENEQGNKELFFGLKENVFCKFPQLGYADDRGNVHENTGFMYDCACSGSWRMENTFQIRVQIVDRYCGQVRMTMVFRDENTVGVRMVKSAEDCFKEYTGVLGAYRKRD